MRWLALVLAVLGASCAAGCGGKTTSSATATAPRVPSVERPQQRGCAFLTAADVSRVAGVDGLRRIDLAPPRSAGHVCGTVFAGAGGSLVVGVAERTGGKRRLNELRKAKVGELGAKHVRAVVPLGPGSFLARERFLAFRRGDRVVTVETGYDAQGQLGLTAAELTKLALVVADRL